MSHFTIVKCGVVIWRNSSKFGSSGTLPVFLRRLLLQGCFSTCLVICVLKSGSVEVLPALSPHANLFTLTFHLSVNKRLGRHSPVSRQCHRPQLNERKEIVPFAFAVDSWVGFSVGFPVIEEACLSLWGRAHAWEIPF